MAEVVGQLWVSPSSGDPEKQDREDQHLIGIVTSATATGSERIAAVNRLTARISACMSLDEASETARQLNSPELVSALLQLLVDGEQLVSLVVQLLHGLCLHADGVRALERGGVLQVLVPILRADDLLLREHGLRLIAALAERPEMPRPLCRAGVPGLLSHLASSPHSSAPVGFTWHWLLTISDGILRAPAALKPGQRKQLLRALESGEQRAHELQLSPADAKLLRRQLGELRVLTSIPRRPAGSSQSV